MAETIPLNPSPKQQFMATKAVSDHNNQVQAPWLQNSLNMALLEYQQRLVANMADANAAAAVSFKLKGALEFIDVFIKLGIVIKLPEPAKIARLDHNA